MWFTYNLENSCVKTTSIYNLIISNIIFKNKIMSDQFAGIIDLLISLIGISAALFLVNNKAKNQTNFEIIGLKIKTINTIGIAGILAVLALIATKYFM